MNFDEWWEEFTAEHDEWRYADSQALRRAAFKAGAASRDTEVVSLTNQRDYEYVRAENAEQERDQLRAHIAELVAALEWVRKVTLDFEMHDSIDFALDKVRKP